MLGIVPDEVFERELVGALPSATSSFTGNLTPEKLPFDILVVDKPITKRGRGRGKKKETPEIIREIIAEEAICGVPAQQIAEQFQVSESSVSAYKHDATSTATYHQPDKQLADANGALRTEIIGTARAKLLAALSHITDEKLSAAKVRDVSGVAKDMSGIIKDMEPPAPKEEVVSPVQFVFHAPQPTQEEKFEVIDISSKET